MTDSQAQTFLPTSLYRAAQVRELDRIAIEDQGVPGIRLMRRAGEAVFSRMLERWPAAASVTVFCGFGNNGGDGYIVAGLAQRRGMQVQLIQVGAEDKLQGDAKTACDWARDHGVQFSPWRPGAELEADIFVDALLGTGLSGSVRPECCDVITAISQANTPVLAVDIPSGLCSDTGAVLGCAIEADATVTFIGVKQGLLTGRGPGCVGALYFDDLGLDDSVLATVAPETARIDWSLLRGHVRPRRRDAHKGDFGRLLVVGGNHGFGGAAVMAAQAGARVGAGLVSLATRGEHVAAAIARCPEIMCKAVESGQDLEPMIASAEVIVVGPGLGQNAWSEQVLRAVLASNKPLVVDADALNLIADDRIGWGDERNNSVITPHPGEAGRLLRSNASAVQADRFAAATALKQRYDSAVVLKGAGTLIHSVADGSARTALCNQGNPGMAGGGMGDILSGVIGGLMAQGFSAEQAAQLGVCLHAAAADRAAQAGERGMLATDLLPHLRVLINA